MPGQKIKYALSVYNGSITRNDTITKIFGAPVNVLNDNGNSASASMDTVGFWGTEQSTYVSPPSCITDSPGADYLSNDHKSITSKNQISLQNAIMLIFSSILNSQSKNF